MPSYEIVIYERACALIACQVDSQRPLSLHEVSDPVQVVASQGFTAGTVVYEKAVGPQNALFIIGNVGQPMLLEKRALLVGEAVVKVQVPVDKFLQEWVVFKGTLPSACSPEVSVSQIIQYRFAHHGARLHASHYASYSIYHTS